MRPHQTGDLVCTFMVQSSLGINDFQPVMTGSTDGGETWSEAQPMWPHLIQSYSIFGSISRHTGRFPVLLRDALSDRYTGRIVLVRGDARAEG